MLWIAVMMGLSVTGVFAQQNSEVPKGQFLDARTSTQSYIKINDVYSADASKLLTEWTSNGFSLQTVNGKALYTTGQYAANVQYYATSTEIKLPEVVGDEKLILQIEEFFKTETKYDNMYVKISADNGQSWRPLSRASGNSDWRSNYMDITAYSNKAVIISLSFSSDDSIESEGWSVADINIYTANSTNQPVQKAQLRSIAANLIETIEIVNVHTEDYPETVFIDFLPKDINGDVIPGLDRSDFRIFNDNTEDGTDCKELYMANYSANPAIDIVFLMDNSGSMYDDQQNVANNLVAMINNLHSSGYDARLALVRFGQGANGGNPIVEPNPSLPTSAFFYNTSDFINFWNAKNTDDGGYEPGYLVMKNAAESSLIQFRDYAEKIFVMITDENVTCFGNSSSVSMQDAINALQLKGIRLFTIETDEACSYNDYYPVCNATNGEYYPDIQSDFSTIFSNLVSIVSSKYTLRFCPPSTTTQGGCIPLRLETTKTPVVSASTCYTPTPLPRLVRNLQTQALDGMQRDENQSIPLGVEVLNADPNDITGVKVYYRKIGVPSDRNTVLFESYSMQRSGATTFYYTIPANKVQRHSIEYYFVAQFVNGTEVSSPTETQEYFAWTIPIKPNYAPNITNVVAPAQSYPCQDITVSATITDNTNYLAKQVLYYKTNQAPSVWMFTTMTPTGISNEFRATIPAQNMQTTGVSYYILAEDDYGTQSWYGTPEAPMVVTPMLTPIASTGASMTIAVYDINNIVTQCSPMSGNDVLKAYFTNSCGQLQEAGSGIADPSIPYISFPIYANSGQGYKNGFDPNETVYFRLIRNGKSYDLTGNNVVKFNPTQPGFIMALSGVGIPQIEVIGNGMNISPDDMIPDANDNTDFGSSSTPVNRTFTITNTGCDDLVVTSIDVDDAANFQTVNLQQDVHIYPGGNHNFTVTYNGTATATAIVSIGNNSINPFNFAVKGTKTGGGPVNCGISVYPNPMTSTDYGGIVAFDLGVASTVSVLVIDLTTGQTRQVIVNSVYLAAGRYNYYISKYNLLPGVYLAVVDINGSVCSQQFLVTP
jgi:hypothetical protein